MGRGYSFEVLCAKMPYTAGIQKNSSCALWDRPFDAVLPARWATLSWIESPYGGLAPTSPLNAGSDFRG